MTIAVIHPHDPSTEFFQEIYLDSWKSMLAFDGHVIDHFTGLETISMLRAALTSYDHIIMCGHGTHKGLIVPSKGGQRILGDKLVEALRKNQHKLALAWCYAREFCEKYDIQPKFATSMWISEMSEALELGVPATEAEIDKSNVMLAYMLKGSCISGAVRAKRYPTDSQVARYNMEGALFSEYVV